MCSFVETPLWSFSRPTIKQFRRRDPETTVWQQNILMLNVIKYTIQPVRQISKTINTHRTDRLNIFYCIYYPRYIIVREKSRNRIRNLVTRNSDVRGSDTKTRVILRKTVRFCPLSALSVTCARKYIKHTYYNIKILRWSLCF